MGEDRQAITVKRQMFHHRGEQVMRIFQLDAEIGMRANRLVMPAAIDDLRWFTKGLPHPVDKRLGTDMAVGIEIDVTVPAWCCSVDHQPVIIQPSTPSSGWRSDRSTQIVLISQY